MNDIAMRLEGISKQYRIGGREEPYKTLRETFSRAASAPFRLAIRLLRGQKRPSTAARGRIWALQDVSFEIKRGEVVGFIGHNGAGKTTLLKILSRITEPTAGFGEVHGTVGSLLEVGAGFHGELTGRENVYLNGAILGMRRAEIDRKFDEIVAFAEIEKFIDTPVKHYSSGMYVRLAFAVAAHLEPEILIIDEVLAVGDAAFQRKCLGKMSDVSSEGRTVLFVSHAMPAVRALCNRCFLLEHGRIVMDGAPGTVIDSYLRSAHGELQTEAAVDLWSHPRREPGMQAALKRIWMTDESGGVTSAAQMGAAVTFHVEYETDGPVRQPLVGLTFETLSGDSVCGTNNLFAAGAKVIDAAPRGVLSCHIPRLPLLAGEYVVTVAFAKWIDRNYDRIRRAFTLEVMPADVFGTGRVPEIGNSLLEGEWKYSPLSAHERSGAHDSDREQQGAY